MNILKLILCWVVVVAAFLLGLNLDDTSSVHDRDEYLDTCELVRSKGFQCETHSVVTPDGYIIDVHRIKPLLPVRGRQPVILQCGLTAVSTIWLLTSAEVEMTNVGNMLGFELAKQGYDVWLANNRGNRYGRRHLRYQDAVDDAFWDYSYDQIAAIDLPAIIEMVRAKTGSATVAYAGHSQGSLVMLALLSRTADWNNIVRPCIALSPVTYMGNMSTIYRHVFAFINRYVANLNKPIHRSPWRKYYNQLATKTWLGRLVTLHVHKLMQGDSDNLNETRMSVLVSHTPSSTSLRNLAHFDQSVLTNRLQQFDYGVEQNLARYGRPRPPPYDLTNVTHPDIHVFYSLNDRFVPTETVEKLRGHLPPTTDFYEVHEPTANHADFILGFDVAREVNHQVLRILAKYHHH